MLHANIFSGKYYDFVGRKYILRLRIVTLNPLTAVIDWISAYMTFRDAIDHESNSRENCVIRVTVGLRGGVKKVDYRR